MGWTLGKVGWGTGGLRVEFTKYTGVITSDLTASEAVVTEFGAVNYRRNGTGGVTRFTPICGESRFSDFTVPGTAAGAAMYSGQAVQPYLEWPYFYNRRESPTRTIWKVNLTTAALTQATASPGFGTLEHHAIASRPELAYIDALRGTGSTTAEMREWMKAAEPSATTSVVTTIPTPYDFDHFHIDESGNYWLGGAGGWVVMLDQFGSTVWSVQLPVDAVAVDYVAMMWVPDVLGGAIAATEQTDGQFNFWRVDSSGGYSDVTANVTVDGVPWDSAGMGIFGAPNVVTTQFGDRIGFRKGTDFYIGTVAA